MPYRSVFHPNLFADKTVIVTGGGSGIGRCTAHELAALGARLVLIGRQLDKLRAVADELLEDTGRAARCFACALRHDTAVRDPLAPLSLQPRPLPRLFHPARAQVNLLDSRELWGLYSAPSKGVSRCPFCR